MDEGDRRMEFAQDDIMLRASVVAALNLKALLHLCLYVIYVLHTDCR